MYTKRDEYIQKSFCFINHFITQFIINPFLFIFQIRTHLYILFFSNQSYILIKSKSNIFICRRLLFRYFDAPVETITDLANMWPEYDHCCRRRLYSGSILVFSIRVHTLGKWYSVSALTPLSRRYKFAFDRTHATKVDTFGVGYTRARIPASICLIWTSFRVSRPDATRDILW